MIILLMQWKTDLSFSATTIIHKVSDKFDSELFVTESFFTVSEMIQNDILSQLNFYQQQ